jgi:hypothetical protein
MRCCFVEVSKKLDGLADLTIEGVSAMHVLQPGYFRISSNLRDSKKPLANHPRNYRLTGLTMAQMRADVVTNSTC